MFQVIQNADPNDPKVKAAKALYNEAEGPNAPPKGWRNITEQELLTQTRWGSHLPDVTLYREMGFPHHDGTTHLHGVQLYHYTWDNSGVGMLAEPKEGRILWFAFGIPKG